MRLLFATDAFPPKSGGSGWSTFYLARALAARNHQIDIVRPVEGSDTIRTREYEGLSVTEFGYHASQLPGLRAWQRASALDEKFSTFLAQRVRDGGADLIHAQHLLTIPPAVNAARDANVPVVSTVRDYWPLCLYGTLWRDDGICPVCRGGELVRCLRQKYGGAANLMSPLIPLVEKELARRQHALQQSDAVIAVSHYVAERLHEIMVPEKIVVVRNLIDLAATRAIPHSEQGGGSPYLVFLGKLNELKGADLLPEILRRSETIMPLHVVGEGPLADSLGREPNIKVRGWLSNHEALQALAGAHALLFPSRWAEPLARTLLEAQALGIPTVAFNTGGTRDIIEHEVNGLLARDLDEFATGVKRVVADKSLQEHLSANAKRIAEEKFGSDIVVAQMESVYRRVLTPKPEVTHAPPHSILTVQH